MSLLLFCASPVACRAGRGRQKRSRTSELPARTRTKPPQQDDWEGLGYSGCRLHLGAGGWGPWRQKNDLSETDCPPAPVSERFNREERQYPCGPQLGSDACSVSNWPWWRSRTICTATLHSFLLHAPVQRVYHTPIWRASAIWPMSYCPGG